MRQVGQWIIGERLGGGAMGSVYRAVHARDPEQVVAVKFFEADAFPKAAERFRHEAAILSSLDHPAICRFHGFFREDDAIVMEFVPGVSLEAHLAEHGPLSPGQVLELARQLVDALTYLHGRGVVHRDLKLANLMLVNGRWIRVVDFGIALDERLERLTQQGMVMGSLPYIPPEAWLGELVPEHSDPYALGVILYACLTGSVPFSTTRDPASTQRALVQKASTPCLQPEVDGAPERLCTLIARLTALDPDERLTRLSDIGRELRAIEEELPPAPLPAPVPVPSPPLAWFGLAGLSGMVVGVVVASALLAIGLVLVGVGWTWMDPEPVSVDNRDVRVVVTGTPDQVPVHGWLGEREPEWDPDRSALGFTGVHVGLHDVEVLAGPECDRLCEELDDCSMCCSRAITQRRIEPGAGPQVVRVNVPPLPTPPEREVWIGVTGIPEPWPVDIEVSREGAAVAGSMDGPRWWRAPALRPGVVDVRVEVGSCSEEHLDCVDRGDCPEGCRSVLATVEVPCGPEASYSAFFPVEPPAGPPPGPTGMARVSAEVPRRTPPAARPDAVSARRVHRASRRQLTHAEFAMFLNKHPRWGQDEAMEAGMADRHYLKRWRRGGPRRGELGEPVTSVSFAAAQAICEDRGGLPQYDDAPWTWTGGAAIEFRLHGSQPWLRTSFGKHMKIRGDHSWTSPVVGVRCRR